MSFGDDVSSSPRPAEEESGNKTCLVFGLVFGGIGVVVLLCGGCCFGIFYFPLQRVSDDIQADLGDNPVINEHIGEITSLDAELTESNIFTDEYQFSVTGTEGSGVIRADCLEDEFGAYRVLWGELQLDNGDVYELFPDGRNDVQFAFDPGVEIDGWAEEGLSDEEFNRQVREDLADHPVIAEHIGAIQRLERDWDLSMQEPGDIWIFDIAGEKGSGRLRANCRAVASDAMDVDAGVLMLDSGETVQLDPDNPLDPLEE